MDFDWKDLGAKVASLGLPILGTALGGPAGATVGALVASVISKQLSPDTPLDALQPVSISQAIDKYGPQAVEALKAELEHDADVKRIAANTEIAYLQDRQSARQREVDIAKVTGSKDTNLYVLAWMVVILFFGLTGFMMFQTVPEANIGPVNQLFGAMATGFGTILAYFYGSSKSSADKTKLMANGK